MTQQLILPTIPQGATEINHLVCVWRDETRWTYYHGCHPVFTHPPGDLKQFRFFTSQLVEAGSCKPVDIIRTFGISKSSVDRSLKKLQEEGPELFSGNEPFVVAVMFLLQRYLNKHSSFWTKIFHGEMLLKNLE
ncbi:MAG: MarR family transcriptional regulator [Deltaproteobacteria bacterium]|nr:MarR family transcriptional regulator [Deltaproteobacteria bacterium]